MYACWNVSFSRPRAGGPLSLSLLSSRYTRVSFTPVPLSSTCRQLFIRLDAYPSALGALNAVRVRFSVVALSQARALVAVGPATVWLHCIYEIQQIFRPLCPHCDDEQPTTKSLLCIMRKASSFLHAVRTRTSRSMMHSTPSTPFYSTVS